MTSVIATANTNVQAIVYDKFASAAAQIADIEPIDYFFAKEMTSSPIAMPLSSAEFDVWYHLLMALSASVRDGHTCLPLSVVANQRFGVASEDNVITHHGFAFPAHDELQQVMAKLSLDDNDVPVVYWQDCLYMRRNFSFERALQAALLEKASLNLGYSSDAISEVIARLFPKTQQEVDWQQIAVANSVNKGLSIIAGGPGTGKTYTVTKLLAALTMLKVKQNNASISKDLDIALVAPTGKAAQRLSESIQNAVAGFRGAIDDQILDVLPTKAQTLHRLLGVIPNQVNFRKGSDNPLDMDLIIIDEVSMVDLPLMERLFRALPVKCQVIMLGDADQLPSVALGSVLADIAIRPHLGYSKANLQFLGQVCQLSKTQVKQLPAAKQECADHLSILLKSRRFDGEGAIGNIAMATIAGRANDSWQYIMAHSECRDDLTLLPAELSLWLSRYVQQYYQPLLSAEKVEDAFALMSKFRILCATRQGSEGVETINQQVIAMLKGHYQQAKLFHGLPIMINENHYGLGLYNGDMGIIWQNAQGHLVACFEEAQSTGYKTVIPSRLPSFEPVFAMTIHKTQGSEFEHVAMVLPSQADNQLLTRELIYTGVTRAKKQLSLSCREPVWYRGVEAKVARHSNLAI
ncbi:exodeoxyribonuclease V subunit alpha [Thalassotalea euphylliae]|uniref:RecBCD enzyme subunit RecD n=1 Tax=Thalassotalea euphylliae TaxID=1655234 RepID=A0A3E0TQV3_9GAMM|nr:exodeoxyribonuclease V subunit alpha [Thalassotalea euphylliae]REL26868.1 exodeoxyribonuclease V subunit alpha [Thalassotalea euphylliae]